jgi:hypothetical protein
MSWRNRKLRLALVLGLAIVVMVVAWRTSQAPRVKPCEPGRHEEKDASGKVVKVTRTLCGPTKG